MSSIGVTVSLCFKRLKKNQLYGVIINFYKRSLTKVYDNILIQKFDNKM